ncbi:MAG: hypothetical protein IT370_23315 [Deltaproteobacteria bacterium]|nr:hypothetical protein [Deltaproteobacteria bacterium]
MFLRLAGVVVITAGLAGLAAGCGDDDDGPATDAGPADAALDGASPDALAVDAGPPCGNGVLDGLEQCDNTTQFNGNNACSTTCQSVEFAVSTTSAGDQGAGAEARVPGLDVAATASLWGVVWSDGSPGAAGGDIRMRLLSRRGAPQTNGIDATQNDFVINLRAGDQLGPRITARNATSDDFAVGWVERTPTVNSIRVRQFGGDATPSDINLGEGDIGATNAVALTSLASIDGAFVAGWREVGGELRARRMMPGTAPLMPLGTASSLIAGGTAAGAQVSLLPGAGTSMWLLIDRGQNDILARRKYEATFWGSESGSLPLINFGNSVVASHAQTSNPVRGIVVLEGATPATDPLTVRRFEDDDGVGTTTTLGTRALSPVVAAGRGGYVVVWIERAAASGQRDQLRAATFGLDGQPILQTRFDGVAGSFLVTSRATPAGADDLGVASPRVAMGSDGSVLVVWRDYAARTGAGTAADTQAEIRGRLFPRLLP